MPLLSLPVFNFQNSTIWQSKVLLCLLQNIFKISAIHWHNRKTHYKWINFTNTTSAARYITFFKHQGHMLMQLSVTASSLSGNFAVIKSRHNVMDYSTKSSKCKVCQFISTDNTHICGSLKSFPLLLEMQCRDHLSYWFCCFMVITQSQHNLSMNWLICCTVLLAVQVHEVIFF